MNNRALIKSLQFFSSLNDEQIEVLLSFSFIHRYPKDYIVYYEKNESNLLLFLLNGSAKAYKIDKNSNEIFLHYIHKNSLISEISNITKNSLYSFSNISLLEDSAILQIDYREFRMKFLNNNILCSEFSNEIILKSQQLQSLITREFLLNSVSKVAMMLHDNLSIFNKLKRAEISLMLHIQPETLSRVLAKLKRNSIIDINVGKVEILDYKALESVYRD